MNFHKAKILLEKINRLHAGMSLDTDNVSPIERDLMLSYVREFYEVFYLEKPSVVPLTTSTRPKATPVPPKVEPKPVVEVTPPPAPKVEPVRVYTPPPPPKAEPVAVYTPPPPVIEPKPEPVQEVKVTPPVVEKVVEEPKPREIKKFNFIPPPPRNAVKTTPITKSNGDGVDLFDTKSTNDISGKLGLSKIEDLKRAFGLNDKMMYTNELFGGDNNVFKNAMEELNSFSSFDQAKVYLMKNVAGKYNWTSKSKSKLAKDFIKTISRRYI